MGKAPAFQTYAADFYMDTAGWDPYAVGIYWRLLMYEWINGALPTELEELTRIGGAKVKTFNHFWNHQVSSKFSVNGNGKLINRRMEEVRQNQSKYSESRRKNVSVRYKDKPTYEPTYVAHKSYIDPALQSSSSSSTLKKESISHSETKLFLTFYAQQFKNEFGTDPVIEWGKDGKIIKGLLKFIPLENLKNLLNKFFSSEDKFIQKSGYTIGVFKSQLNKLKIGAGTKDGMDLWLTVRRNRMQEKDRKQFAAIMRRLKVTFPTSLDSKDEALRAEVYWEEFSTTLIETFSKAVNDAIAHCSFFPKPTELYEFIKFYAETKYLQGQRVEVDHQLEWMYPTEEGKALAKQYLANIFDVVEKDIMKPKLKGARAKEFEEKRKAAKEKARVILR